MKRMTDKDYLSTAKLLVESGIKFDAKIVERVNNNWLTKEFPQWFENLNDNMRVVAFLRLSNQKGCETMLGGDIANIIINAIIEKQN